MRIAYLVSQYPAYSHAFIETEVTALRARGHHVTTYSVNPPDAQLRTPLDPSYVIKTFNATTARTCLVGLVTRPGLALAILLGGFREMWIRGLGIRKSLRVLGYCLESVVVSRWIRDDKPDHLHVHFANNAADIALLRSLANASRPRAQQLPWSISVHGPSDFEQAQSQGLARKLDSASFVRTISNYARAVIVDLVGERIKDKVYVVRMGIDIDDTARAQCLRPDRGCVSILFVGRLVAEKNPDVLLQACCDLMKRLPRERARVTFVGAGPLRSYLGNVAEAAPPNLTVVFSGAMAHKAVLREYINADIFCLPSSQEGLPVVLMEAMARECAVISSPIAAIPELVADGRNGLLVPPRDRYALSLALETLVKSRPLRDQLGSAARISVNELHDIRRNIGALEELIAGHLVDAPNG